MIASENGSVVVEKPPNEFYQQQVEAAEIPLALEESSITPATPLGAIGRMPSPVTEAPNRQKVTYSPTDLEENFSDYDDPESPRPPTFTLDDL